MTQSLGRAPSPYAKRTQRQRASNDNRPAPRPGKPANSNVRSFNPPRSVTRGIDPALLRRAVPKAMARRAILTAARAGLRFIPYVGMALTLYELLGLMAELLRRLGPTIGGRYPGYSPSCQTGKGRYIYGSSYCGDWGYWDIPSMQHSHKITLPNIASQTAGSFAMWDIIPGGAIIGGIYYPFRAQERWVKNVGATNPAPKARTSTSPSPIEFIDAIRSIDPVLGAHVEAAIHPAPVFPPMMPPYSPPSETPVRDPDELLLSKGPRYIIGVGGRPGGAPRPVAPGKPGPSTAKPPPRGTKEKKFSTSGKVAAAIFRGLDKLSETAEVIDIIFQSLPCEIQKNASRNRPNRGLLDQAGQYGIDGADWKTPVILRHYDKIDWAYAMEGIARNEVEDQIIGRMNKAVKSVYKGPADMVTGTAGKKISKYVGIAPRCK